MFFHLLVLIQSNHHLFFAVRTLPGLTLLCGCCLMTTGRRCCYSVRCCTQQSWEAWRAFFAHDGRYWRWDLLGMRVSNEGNLRSMNPSNWESIKGNNLKDNIQAEQSDLHEAFKQEMADYSDTMHNSKCSPNSSRFEPERSWSSNWTVQLLWIQKLKMPVFFCLHMLEIWIQTMFEAKWS